MYIANPSCTHIHIERFVAYKHIHSDTYLDPLDDGPGEEDDSLGPYVLLVRVVVHAVAWRMTYNIS
jgi:hypothetical protein